MCSDLVEALVSFVLGGLGVVNFTTAFNNCPIMALLPICLGFVHCFVDVFAVYELVSERRHEARVRRREQSATKQLVQL